MNFGDNNKIHFSKIVIILCLIFAISVCFIAAFIPMGEGVAIALITAGGGIASTAVVFNLRKSQAENTLKIYLSAYERILELKHNYNNDEIEDDADELCDRLDNQMLDKIDQTFENHINDATTIIEKQEIG